MHMPVNICHAPMRNTQGMQGNMTEHEIVQFHASIKTAKIFQIVLVVKNIMVAQDKLFIAVKFTIYVEVSSIHNHVTQMYHMVVGFDNTVPTRNKLGIHDLWIIPGAQLASISPIKLADVRVTKMMITCKINFHDNDITRYPQRVKGNFYFVLAIFSCPRDQAATPKTAPMAMWKNPPVCKVRLSQTTYVMLMPRSFINRG